MSATPFTGARRLAAALVVGATIVTACASDRGVGAEAQAAAGADGAEAAAARAGEPGVDRTPPADAAVADDELDDEAARIEANRRMVAEAVRPEVEIRTDWPSDIEELYGRYWLYWEAFAAAFGPPHADPDHETLAELSTPANWASLQDQLTGFHDEGIVLVLPEDSVTEHLLFLPAAAVLDRTEGAEVVIHDCWIDDFVQMTTDGRVLSEADRATLMNVSMKVVGGQWRVNGVTRSSAETDGYDQCASYAS